MAEELPEGPIRDAIVKQFGEDVSLADVGKAWVESRKQLSSTRRVPTGEANTEEWGNFYDHLGRPSSPDKYELPEAPEALKGTLEHLRDVAWNQGLSQDQFAGLAQEAGVVANSNDTKMAEAKKAWEAKVRAELGDDADTRLQLADSTMQKLLADHPDAAEVIKQTGLDRHPAITNMLLQMGDAMTDDSAPLGSSPGQAPAPSGQDLYSNAMKIMDSEAFKMQQHPENALAQSKLMEVVAQLHAMGYTEGINDPRFTVNPHVSLPEGWTPPS